MLNPRSTVTEVEAQAVRAAVWDRVLPGELSFDFSARPAPKRRSTRGSGSPDRVVSIKDAIIRWLDEQL